MKKTASLLALVLSFGFSSNAISQQFPPAYGSLVNQNNGGQHNGWDGPGHGGHNNGHNGGQHDGPPMPPIPHPEPWHPGPGPQQNQNFKLISIGSYSTSGEADAARNEVLRVLGEYRILVMESRVEYNAGYHFVITYNAREQLNVAQYHAGSYSTSGAAREAAGRTAAALKAQGRAVIEAPVFYNAGYTYTVAYVNMNPGMSQQPDQFQKFNSIGGYSTSGQAEAGKDAAVRTLGELGITVMEARVEYNAGYRFVITYCFEEELPVEQYHGGSYPTSGAAQQAADQTAATLKAGGKAVVETNVFYSGGYTYTVAYITLRHGHHQQDQLQTMNSFGSYSTSGEAERARAEAVQALGGLRVVVMESRVEYSGGYRFVITYTSREPLAVEQYRGGSYSTSGAARQSAEQTAAALRSQGRVVVETSVLYSGGYTYIVGYVSPRW